MRRRERTTRRARSRRSDAGAVGAALPPAPPSTRQGASRQIEQPAERAAANGGLRVFELFGQRRDVAVEPLVVLVTARQQDAQLEQVVGGQRHAGLEARRQRTV